MRVDVVEDVDEEDRHQGAAEVIKHIIGVLPSSNNQTISSVIRNKTKSREAVGGEADITKSNDLVHYQIMKKVMSII